MFDYDHSIVLCEVDRRIANLILAQYHELRSQIDDLCHSSERIVTQLKGMRH